LRSPDILFSPTQNYSGIDWLNRPIICKAEGAAKLGHLLWRRLDRSL